MSQQIYHRDWYLGHLSFSSYLNQLLNYRYHWHEDEYELSIVMTGRAEYIRGADSFTLEPDDGILIPPGAGHASYGLEKDTIALVVRFSRSAFSSLHGANETVRILAAPSSYADRYDAKWRMLRRCAAELLLSMASDGPTSELRFRSAGQRLVAELFDDFPHEIVPMQRDDLYHQRVMRTMTTYLEEHFSEKITLEDMAQLTGYNRTYLSTLFRDTVGIRFYDYLTRIRLANAMYDLKSDSIALTDIAIGNGFPDLKNFNLKFREVFHVSPMQYRKFLFQQGGTFLIRERRFVDLAEPRIRETLLRYMDGSKPA
ncbi:MAG: helix-turn-helix domain-containing protein [Lachnospiraceae bacterium]